MRLADESTLNRITQLTQKTNQFNLTTKRYKEEDIHELSKSGHHLVESVMVADKFGDYGTTGVVIIKKDLVEKCWNIGTFLLSCRILGKNIEFALMKDIIEKAKIAGMKSIKGIFIPTKKNKPAENFFEDCGFITAKNQNEAREYIFDLSKEFKKEVLVEMKEWKN